MTATCPLCDVPTTRILTETLRRGTGIVYHCESCDYGFLVSPGRTDYASDYRRHASHRADGAATNPQEIFDAYSKYQVQRLAFVLPHLGSPLSASVLEIGASAGQFLHHLRDLCATRCAIEPDRACCEFMTAKGIATDHRPLAETRFANTRFDVVCAFQTLEHVDDPVAFLRDVRSVLKPQGRAFVEVPNLYDHLRSIWALPEYEAFYFHSDHASYFSKASLEAVAKRAGFEGVEVHFIQDYSLLNTLSWLSNRAPQVDNRGLAPIGFTSNNGHIAHWLTDTLTRIDAMYTDYLVMMGATSNLMAVLKPAI